MQPNPPEIRHLLGVLSPGERKLEGKSFYLDALKSRLAAVLVEAISHLGGTVEGFLNKDVSCVVTCSLEGLRDARAPGPQQGSGLRDARAPGPQQGSGLRDARAPGPQQGSGLRDARAPGPQQGSGLRDARAPGPQQGSGLRDARAPGPQQGSGLRDGRTEAPRGGSGLMVGRTEASIPRGGSGLMVGRAEASSRGGSDGMGGKEASSARPTKQREGVPTKNSTPRPLAEQVYGSRGKALLEKAIRNNERLQGSSVLASARSWGVRIVHVDDFLSYVQLLKAEKVKCRRPEQRNTNKGPATKVVKAVALKSPYLKVEDSCRKYKPLHMQSMTFPKLFYCGRRSSPFEPLPPPQPERIKEKKQDKAREMVKELSTSHDRPPCPLLRVPCPLLRVPCPLLRVPSPCRARKKNLGYCECCQEPFQDQEQHLQSEHHRAFLLDPSHYSVVDQLVAGMQPGFHPDPPQEPPATLMRVPTPPSLVPPSPPDLEHHTHSEAEHAVRTLLTHGAPPGVLSESPNPLAARPASPGLANLPLYTQPLSPRPDTPSSLYSQPPVLSPENVEPVDFHQPYSDPPVLSPQVLLRPTEPEDVEMRSAASASSEADLIHRAALEAPWGPMGPNQGGPLLGNSRLTCGRSGALPLNPRKRCRSASPDPSPNNNKRRRTSLSTHQRSEPSTGRTGQEAQPLTSFPRTECDPLAKASRQPVETSETSDHRPTEKERVCRNRLPAVTAHTQETSHHGNSKANCRPRSNSGRSNSGRSNSGRSNSQSAKPSARHGNPSAADMGAGGRSCPAPPTPRLFTPPLFSPRERTRCPPSSQDSHPSLSQSFSSVCIESALVPDLAALSPSHSSSEWDYELLARLCPPAAPAAAPSLSGAGGLDMELLQRPCAWTHDAGYESRLYSVLRPPTPPPSLCGEESGPATFARVMQSVEVQH